MKLDQGGTYLKANSVSKGDIIVFQDEGAVHTSDKYFYDEEKTQPKRSLIFTVKHKNEEKKLRVNATSRRQLIDAFGDDTANWIGRQAEIMILPTPKGDNKMIILEPVLKEAEAWNKDVKESWDA